MGNEKPTNASKKGRKREEREREICKHRVLFKSYAKKKDEEEEEREWPKEKRKRDHHHHHRVLVVVVIHNHHLHNSDIALTSRIFVLFIRCYPMGFSVGIIWLILDLIGSVLIIDAFNNVCFAISIINDDITQINFIAIN